MPFEKALIPTYGEILAEFKDTLFTHGLTFSVPSAVEEDVQNTDQKPQESAASNPQTNVSNENSVQVVAIKSKEDNDEGRGT